MNVKYKSNNNIVYSCKYHVVWCAKYRRKVLTDGVDVRLKELLLEYSANLSVDIDVYKRQQERQPCRKVCSI